MRDLGPPLGWMLSQRILRARLRVCEDNRLRLKVFDNNQLVISSLHGARQVVGGALLPWSHP